MRYVDSNIVIFNLVADKRFGLRAKKYLESIALGKEIACSSVYLLVEVYAFLKGAGGTETEISAVLRDIMSYGIILLPLDADILQDSINMMKDGWKFGDSVHYNTMVKNKISEIVTDDRHFDRLEKVKRVDILGFL